jgi:predicted ATPase
MHLTSLSINKLHGALTLDVDFRPDVTLLVGINGSGKTSVLNCIEVLLRPDMRRLATLDYERLALTFERDDRPFTIVAAKSEKRVSLSIEGGSDELQPITIDLVQGIDPEDDEATEHYAQLGPEKHERPLWEFLKSLPRPIVITLDRTIAAEADDSLFFEAIRPNATRRARVRSPLAYVQEVTSAGYASYRKRAIAADDELKAEIVMSALQEPDFLTTGRSAKPLTSTELGRLEDKVVSYLSKTVKAGDVAHQVRAFFQSSSRIASRRNQAKLQQDLLLDMVGSRYRQIESLAKAFNNYENKNSIAFSKLGGYLDTINGFFRDSNKELYFDESTGRLVFSFLREGARIDARRGIKHLSSGERQVLILFTFLAFASSSSKVFIVDEPELSLHPKWQHEFMDAFLRLKPEGAQVLLATHSPEIVGKHKSACVSLRVRER